MDASEPRNSQESPLPEWNLDDLYPSPESESLEDDLAEAARLSGEFETRWKGRLSELDGGELAEAIAAYETLSELSQKVASYAYLHYAGDVSDGERGRFLQTVNERITAFSTQTLFFELEINKLDDAVLGEQLKDPAAARYAPWVREVRAFRDHQLSDELEKLLHEKSVTGRSSWMRLFDETMAALRFEIRGEELTLSSALNLLSDPDGTRRRDAAEVLSKVLVENERLFALVTNTLAKDKEIEDQWRGHARPVSSRNLSNRVEDEVVEALVGSVKEAYPNLSHRYYRLKAKWFGVEKLETWDRNAPLPDDDDRTFDWDEARETVLGAYEAFTPDMAAIARRFFDEGWIDAPPRPGKDSGAFAHPVVPSVHPYVFLNFHGKARDVMTLAHELGHGVHQVLSAGQGTLMADTPLTLAETASVFGEMLTFRAMLDGEGDPARKRTLLASKVEDMLNTVVRQIAFHEFERRVHDERRGGELAPERLGEIWMAVQKESLGPAFHYGDDYRVFWSYIPHFIHSPFYVYAYAFGDCLVNSLYRTYQDGLPDFEAKYLDMLRAGGTLRHKELLAPFGLDASDPGFWKRGLSMVEGFVDELEGLE